MPDIRKRAVLPYSPEQIYALVDHIELYPTFLPWCDATTVHHRSADEVKATICVAKGGVKHAFTTLNCQQAPKSIKMQLVEGPFKSLHGIWLFERQDNGHCLVSFDLQFEFTNRLIAMTIGTVLQKIAESLFDAFCDRARALYGDA